MMKRKGPRRILGSTTARSARLTPPRSSRPCVRERNASTNSARVTPAACPESSADMRGAHATVRAIETSTTAAYAGADRVSPSPMAPGVATVRARIAMLPAATTTFSMTQPTAARKGVTARPGRNIDAVRSIVPMQVEKPSTWRASRATTKIPATRRACRRRTPLVHEEKWVVDRARALSIDTVHHLFLRGVTWLIDPDDAGWGTHDD